MNSYNQVIISYKADKSSEILSDVMLQNDIKKLNEYSEQIKLGNGLIQKWLESKEGTFYSSNGDSGNFGIYSSNVPDLEDLRQKYAFATNSTLSMGIGKTLSQADRALTVAKYQGANKIVEYDKPIQQIIDKIIHRIKNGESDFEEKKLFDKYVDQFVDDSYTEKTALEVNREFSKKGETSPEIPKPTQEKIGPRVAREQMNFPMDENDPEMQEKEGNMNDRKRLGHKTGDEDGIPAKTKAYKNSSEEHDENESPKKVPDYEKQTSPQNVDENKEIVKEGIDHDLDNEDQETDHLDDTTLDTNERMKGRRSVKDSFNEDEDDDSRSLENESKGSEEGDEFFDDESERDLEHHLADEENSDEEDPDMGDVLMEGLDDNSQDIQKEKIINMVASALDGFKANKDILERAKEKAPELYNSTINMLKAMVEMAKLLGLNAEDADIEEELEDEEHALEDGDEDKFDRNETSNDGTQEGSEPEFQEDDQEQEKLSKKPFPTKDKMGKDDAKADKASKFSPKEEKKDLKEDDGKKKDHKSVGPGLGRLPKKNTTHHVPKLKAPEGAVNTKGQKKVTDKNGRVHFVNMREGRVKGPGGVPVKG